MLKISDTISIPLSEVELNQIRSSGPGGQHVNKVSTAVHLRFDINLSSLPAPSKQQLLRFHDRRITADGQIIIKAQQFRSLEKNKQDALQRLQHLISSALKRAPTRRPTRPTIASRRKRIETKNRNSRLKSLRKKVSHND